MAKKKLRRIAMVGTAATGVQAPFADPGTEIWGVGSRFEYVTRATRWFELHRLDGEPADWAVGWRKQLKSWSSDGVELWMAYPEPLGPKIVPFPIQTLSARFGTYFMTSSFSWMMALAIHELRPVVNGRIDFSREGEISVYGVDMEYGTEYREQRSGFRHFIEFAKFLDIPVNILAKSGLAYEPVPYPFWQDDPLLNMLHHRKQQTVGQLDQFEKMLQNTRGLIAQNRAVLAELKPGNGYDETRARLTKELETLLDTSATLSRQIVQAQGAYEEQSHNLDYLKST